jgi:hypothetical protein
MSVLDATPLLRRPRKFHWYWNSNIDSWSSNDDWMKFTDIENEIIEDAFDANKKEVKIDGGYIIDLKRQIQYNNLDDQKQQQIKRIELDLNVISNNHLREERFSLPVPLVATSPIKTIEKEEKDKFQVQLLRGMHHFPTSYLWLTTSRNATFADIVEEAAQGILKEGTDLSKKCEAIWLADQLRAVKHYGENINKLDEVPDEIGRMCVFLYTKESFLFKSINNILRDIYNITLEKLKKFGPFSALLSLYLEQIQTTTIETVYRGLNLTDEERCFYMCEYVVRFSAFTSTSTNRELANWYGNTLLIIKPNFYSRFYRTTRSYGVYIASLSYFPLEEEFLIYPATLFEFTRYDYDDDTKKHIIYLTAFTTGNS